jgi:RsiW-degrading membrane proteinase PrsW (M82 family)
MSDGEPRRGNLDIALLLFALAGTACSAFAAAVLAMLALASALVGETETALGMIWLGSGFVVTTAAGLPLLVDSVRAVFGNRPASASQPSALWAWMALLFPPAVALGYLASSQDSLTALLGPPAQVLAASIPVAVVVHRVRRYVPPVPPRRSWGQFLLGLWVAPPIALVLESLVLIPVLLLGSVGLSLSTAGRQLLELTERAAEVPESVLLSHIADVVSEPWFLLLALGTTSILIPALEEGIKTIGLWPLLLRRPEPWEAYLGGVLGGAGFALVEALFLPQPGSEWVAVMIGRVGTTLMHTFTAGLVGWAVGDALSHRRLSRLAIAYLGAVALHGLWNASLISIGLLSIASYAEGAVSEGFVDLVTLAGLVVLGGIAILCLIGLPWVARRLKPSAPPAAPGVSV